MKDKFRYLIHLKLAAGQRRSINTILKLGKFYDRRYGEFEVTQQHFDSFIKNFSENVYGQDLPVDIAHMGDEGGGSAGWFRRLFQDGKRLRAEIEWTDFGVEKVTRDGYKYLSSDYFENWKDNEQRIDHGPTLVGAGLTIRPAIKNMEEVTLSSGTGEQFTGRILLHEEIIQQLREEQIMKKGEFLERLRKALAAVGGLPETMRIQLSKNAELFITGEEKEDDISGLISAQVKLAESMVSESKKLSTPAGMTVEEVKKMISDAEAEKSATARQLTERKSANLKVLDDAVKAAAGMDDEEKKTLSEGLAGMITGAETEEQIKAIVATQIKLSEGSISKAKLATMGFRGHISVEGEGERGSKQFSEHLDDRLGFKNMPASKRFKNTGSLRPINKEVAEKLLAHYDKYYAVELAEEGRSARKLLAGGVSGMADTNLPYTVMRTVIREAVFDLIAANFVAIDTQNTDGISPTVLIPYIKRQAGNPRPAALTVYERGSIPNAGYIQDFEIAQTNPRKLGIQFTNEVAFFTRVSQIDYNAVGESLALITRLMKEYMEILLLTEVIMATDEYSVVPIAGEVKTAQVDGTHTTFQLAHWPLVRPRKTYDLKGTQVGATVNPIVVLLNAVALNEYDGSGTQANGTYYQVSNYTLGQIQIVNQAGVVQIPANTTPLVISYSYTTNLLTFDKHLTGTTKYEDNLNVLLHLFGRRKASLYQDRYAIPNFALMSAVLNNMISEASQFEQARQIAGVESNNDGNLEMIKGIPCFGSNVPLPQMGDLRILIGERFQTMQKVVKPWSINPNFTEAVNSTGNFIGVKQTYGEQYDGLMTPPLTKQKYTEIVAYDSTLDIGPF